MSERLAMLDFSDRPARSRVRPRSRSKAVERVSENAT